MFSHTLVLHVVHMQETVRFERFRRYRIQLYRLVHMCISRPTDRLSHCDTTARYRKIYENSYGDTMHYQSTFIRVKMRSAMVAACADLRLSVIGGVAMSRVFIGG